MLDPNKPPKSSPFSTNPLSPNPNHNPHSHTPPSHLIHQLHILRTHCPASTPPATKRARNIIPPKLPQVAMIVVQRNRAALAAGAAPVSVQTITYQPARSNFQTNHHMG